VNGFESGDALDFHDNLIADDQVRAVFRNQFSLVVERNAYLPLYGESRVLQLDTECGLIRGLE
jgi:hypothetical protein